MQVESSKSFKHGFIITEQELRRIIEILNSQFEKLNKDQHPIIKFKFKFKNGVVAETATIDDILSQENIGSAQIVKLNLHYQDSEENEKNSINIEFQDPNYDDDSYNSIKIKVSGETRDWVFVTISLLEERISKIKRTAIPNLIRKNFTALFMPVFMLLFMASTFIMIPKFINSTKDQGKLSSALESATQNGEVETAIDALIFMEKYKESHDLDINSSSYLPKLFGIFVCIAAIICLLVFFLYLFVKKYFPIYNFCWGDYVEFYKKKESVRRFVLIVIGIGIFVSFVGGLLANLF